MVSQVPLTLLTDPQVNLSGTEYNHVEKIKNTITNLSQNLRSLLGNKASGYFSKTFKDYANNWAKKYPDLEIPYNDNNQYRCEQLLAAKIKEEIERHNASYPKKTFWSWIMSWWNDIEIKQRWLNFPELQQQLSDSYAALCALEEAFVNPEETPKNFDDVLGKASKIIKSCENFAYIENFQNQSFFSLTKIANFFSNIIRFLKNLLRKNSAANPIHPNKQSSYRFGTYAMMPPEFLNSTRLAPQPDAIVTEQPRRTTYRHDNLCKILLVGDAGVGKDELLRRFAEDSFSTSFPTTIGINFKIKQIEVNNQKINLQISDTAGEERPRAITPAYYRGVQGIMLVYDITDNSSFQNIRNWHRSIQLHTDNTIKMVLVGAKLEENDKRAVSHEEGSALANELGIPFFECSAQKKIKVTEAFVALTKCILAASSEQAPPSTQLTSNTTRCVFN